MTANGSERLTPAPVFNKVGVDYVGPLKTGPTRKPIIRKVYVCLFVCMAVKAVHLKLVNELTLEAFLATLRRYVSRRGRPTDIFSDHGTNFVGADHKLTEIHEHLKKCEIQKAIIDSSSLDGIQWHFFLQFRWPLKAAVRSFKIHLLKVAGNLRLTYEELSTILAQIVTPSVAPLPTSD